MEIIVKSPTPESNMYEKKYEGLKAFNLVLEIPKWGNKTSTSKIVGIRKFQANSITQLKTWYALKKNFKWGILII